VRSTPGRCARCRANGYRALVAERMQRARLLEDPIPDPAHRWIETFLDAYGGEVHTLGEALTEIAALRAESTTVPALELERFAQSSGAVLLGCGLAVRRRSARAAGPAARERPA